MFLAPVKSPEGAGYYNLIWQMQDGILLYTPLDQFRRAASAAQAVMSVTVFDELVEAKGLALIRADILQPVLTKDQAAEIIRLTREFYGEADKFEWVKRFNHSPNAFVYEDFVKQFPQLFES